MALNSPSNLSLGTLGHITAGNGNTTTQTSLAAGCRGATSSTAMWADFRCGTLTVDFVSGSGFSGSGKGYFKIGLKNDVGTYMGGGASVTFLSSSLVNDLNDDVEISYYYQLGESGEGSLYQTRIANNSDNSGDYEGDFDEALGGVGFNAYQDSTNRDKFRFRGTGS